MKNTVNIAVLTMIAIIAIGTIGMVSAVTTDVTYIGDGSYSMNFDGSGTGYCGVHTYTSNGEDHMQATWQNAEASGWQTMDTSSYAYTNPTSSWWGRVTGENSGSGSATTIDRIVTVGGRDDGADASGSIRTSTTDNNGNTLYTIATYQDDVAWTSHVTTDQHVSIYQDECSGFEDSRRGFYHDEYAGSDTGVSGQTDISGFAYGTDTLVTGLIMTQSGDAYSYALVKMTNGKFDLNADTHAESGEYSNSGWIFWGWFPYSYSGEHAKVNERFDVDANGVGLFIFGAGEDDFGGYAYLYDDGDDLYVYIDADTGVFYTVTQINGNLGGAGYIYSIDLP